MPYILGLPDALARRGLTVEVVPGWETRGSHSFNPVGSVAHWTAGPRVGDRPSLNVCVKGRPDLPGPLCNVFLTRSGVAVVVAAGRASHAGKGGAHGLVGNSSVFGTEAECSGDGDWTPAQIWAYPRIIAAYVDLGALPQHIISHSEWAPTRKIDIRDRIGEIRAHALELVADPEQEDDMTPEQDKRLFDVEYKAKENGEKIDAIYAAVGRIQNAVTDQAAAVAPSADDIAAALIRQLGGGGRA